MASSGSHLIEIDEKFCQCPICLQQYKEPKLLPCLHRYCSDCLKQLIGRDHFVNTLSCPECRTDVEIPEGGIAGFKTDFHMKNIIEYIQLQKSLEGGQTRLCCDCLNKAKVAAYCFKCNDFLCKECYNIHLTKNILKDHKQHTFSLEDIKSNHLALEKLSLLKEAPRCQSHPEDLCRLCCRTCNNLPICVNCTYGSHEDHSIKEVSMLAAQAKGALRLQLSTLGENKERIYEMAETVNRVRKELLSDVNKKKETFQKRYTWNVKMIKAEMKNIEEYKKIKETEIENIKEKDLIERRKQMEKAITEINTKYDKICHEIMNDSKTKLTHVKQQYNKDLENSKKKLSNLEINLNQFMTAIEKRLDERLKKLEEMSEHVESTRKRFENLTATASFVLETRNDWTTVQCIPDIQRAVEPLNREMEMEFPELERMSFVHVNAKIKESEDSPIHINAFRWYTEDISGNDDSGIVITGWEEDCQESRICQINIQGDVLRQKTVESLGWCDRCCAYMSQQKVVTTCTHNEIGVYDLREKTYVKKKIPDAIRSWPTNSVATCVATDSVSNHILVTCGGKDVYVLDHQLHFLHTLTLPEIIGCVNDMTVNEGNLIVCSDSNNAAYVVTMEGSECKLLHELMQPDLGEDDWAPFRVCADKNGYIYLLWEREDLEINVCVVQYNAFNYELMMAKMLDGDACCITTVETNQTEKLLIATDDSRKLYIYEIGGVLVL